MERVNQPVFTDRIESFDDYNPCMQKEENECNILHVHNWIQFFVCMYNDTTTRNKTRLGNDLKEKILQYNGIISENADKKKCSTIDCPRCDLLNQEENKFVQNVVIL